MTTTQFTTAKSVSEALQKLGFSADKEMLITISRNCRDEFQEHLLRCVEGQDADHSSATLIGNLLYCLSPDTVDQLRAIVPQATQDRIATVGIRYSKRLSSAIDAASEPEHPHHAQAKAYLTNTFAAPAVPQSNVQPELNIASTPAPRPERPVGAQQRVPEPPPASRQSQRPTSASLSPAASVSSQTKQEGKQYQSCHVYGSSYALTFNVGEWNGEGGIMVDAAVSDGFKSYDWQNALHVWLNLNEVSAVMAVLRRWRPGVALSGHGAQNDKSFPIEFQRTHFFAKVMASKAKNHPARAVQISPTETAKITMMLTLLLRDSYPQIPVPEILGIIRDANMMESIRDQSRASAA